MRTHKTTDRLRAASLSALIGVAAVATPLDARADETASIVMIPTGVLMAVGGGVLIGVGAGHDPDPSHGHLTSAGNGSYSTSLSQHDPAFTIGGIALVGGGLAVAGIGVALAVIGGPTKPASAAVGFGPGSVQLVGRF